ncbi:hypothetical protein BB560_003810 [Smittium megazygosporum]|uniref:Uncharacterized protein n=1 Tax=Smittium megazygosporum TaxID=133381 RepID=A0A2T9ZAX4_9FUNG|nr:hypothetical protein BB560_003810 [Smittium megazygosporum]
MSWKELDNSGVSDLEQYTAFLSKFSSNETITSILDGNYEGEDKSIIEEKLSADMSTIGVIFDSKSQLLNSQRYRAMRIRAHLEKYFLNECIKTDNDWSHLLELLLDKESLSEYQKQETELLGKIEKNKTGQDSQKEANQENQIPGKQRIASLRPFCLYSVDAEYVYGEKLEGLPKDPVQFVKLAFYHELDCIYEDDDFESSFGEIQTLSNKNQPENVLEIAQGKTKILKQQTQELDQTLESFVEQNTQNDLVLDEFPYESNEILNLPITNGFKLLGPYELKFKELFSKHCGISDFDKFECYSVPGRHYIVCWIDSFGIYGLRLIENLSISFNS